MSFMQHVSTSLFQLHWRTSCGASRHLAFRLGLTSVMQRVSTSLLRPLATPLLQRPSTAFLRLVPTSHLAARLDVQRAPASGNRRPCTLSRMSDASRCQVREVGHGRTASTSVRRPLKPSLMHLPSTLSSASLVKDTYNARSHRLFRRQVVRPSKESLRVDPAECLGWPTRNQVLSPRWSFAVSSGMLALSRIADVSVAPEVAQALPQQRSEIK